MIIAVCFNRCWSLKFKQSDHQFLHQSNVFHHINNILSKSDDGDSEESFNISVQSGYEALSQVRKKISVFVWVCIRSTVSPKSDRAVCVFPGSVLGYLFKRPYQCGRHEDIEPPRHDRQPNRRFNRDLLGVWRRGQK